MSERFQVHKKKFDVDKTQPKKPQRFDVETVPIDDQLISETKAIEEGGVEVREKRDLAKIVEVPLLTAAEELYDKNIRAVWSSANKQNVGNEASLSIHFYSLRERPQRERLNSKNNRWRGH